MLNIRQEDAGVSFVVKVAPRASRDELGPMEAGALKVRLTAPPVEGAANQALVKLLAKKLKVAKSSLSIIKGLKSRHKRVLIEGLGPDQVRKALQ